MTWFLSSLVFCWILTPITTKVIKNNKRYDMFLLCAIVIFRFLYKTFYLFYIGTGSFCYTNVFPPYRFLEYLSGMLLAAFYLNQEEKIKNSFIQLLGISTFLLCFWINTRYGSFDVLFIIFELFLIYTLVFVDGIISKIANNRLVKHLSELGFPFFIVHQVVIKYFNWIIGWNNIVGKKYYFIIILGVVIVVCEIYTYLCTELKKVGRKEKEAL